MLYMREAKLLPKPEPPAITRKAPREGIAELIPGKIEFALRDAEVQNIIKVPMSTVNDELNSLALL